MQNALMQILIDHGAVIDRPRGVGNNHCSSTDAWRTDAPPAAEFLAARGAPLDLEGAAGIGRLDVVPAISIPAAR